MDKVDLILASFPADRLVPIKRSARFRRKWTVGNVGVHAESTVGLNDEGVSEGTYHLFGP